MSERVTIREVAERAGCSIATVSRVLNNSGSASQEIRERVLSSAASLGFQFNEVGRSLQSKRSRTLGIVVPSLSNPVFAAAIDGIQSAARARGYQILLSCSRYNPTAETEAVQTLTGKQVDGVILTVCNPDGSKALDVLKHRKVPYCLIFNQPTTPEPSVGVDNVAAAAAVCETVLRAGHRHLAFVAVSFQSSERSRLRYQGLCAAAAAFGAPPPELIQVDPDLESLEQRLSSSLAEGPELTAVLASNDVLALGCIRALRRLGRRVPQDLSVFGFDGITIAELVEPGLSTVSIPNEEMGGRAAGLLIDAIAEDRMLPPRSHFLPFELKVRGSLGCCDAEGRRRERSRALRRDEIGPRNDMHTEEAQ